jgi:glycosyltransferase involved in cell wall biosynthesis
MIDGPLVSVGLQFYNNEETLRQAVRSIVNQSYGHWELILHDDGSTDSSRHVAQSFGGDSRIQFHLGRMNLGRSERLNQSIDLARGKYYAIMDSDDVAYPGRLEQQVAYLQEHPEVDVVGGQMLTFKGNGIVVGKRTVPLEHEEICRMPMNGFGLAHPTCLGKIEFFKQYRYRPAAIQCEDFDLWFRSYQSSCFGNLPNVIYGYREDRIDLRKIATMRRGLARILFDAFVRRGRFDLALGGVAFQTAKLMLDLAAVFTGLGYHLLRHRAQPTLTEEEMRTWSQVWGSVN